MMMMMMWRRRSRWRWRRRTYAAGARDCRPTAAVAGRVGARSSSPRKFACNELSGLNIVPENVSPAVFGFLLPSVSSAVYIIIISSCGAYGEVCAATALRRIISTRIYTTYICATRPGPAVFFYYFYFPNNGPIGIYCLICSGPPLPHIIK